MTPRDTRAEIAQKLSEILLGMDHATGDRNLQIWIATEGINEALALLTTQADELDRLRAEHEEVRQLIARGPGPWCAWCGMGVCRPGCPRVNPIGGDY